MCFMLGLITSVNPGCEIKPLREERLYFVMEGN